MLYILQSFISLQLTFQSREVFKSLIYVRFFRWEVLRSMDTDMYQTVDDGLDS